MNTFSNSPPPNNDLTEESVEQLCKDIATATNPRIITGVWMRRVLGQWRVIVAWTNPFNPWFKNPEYGMICEDGSLIYDLHSDWMHMLVTGRQSRFTTARCKWDPNIDVRAFYGTLGK